MGEYSSGNIYIFHFWFLQEIKEALLRKRQELKMTIMSLKFSLAVNEEVNVAEFWGFSVLQFYNFTRVQL